jgi:hypothetical protein
MLDHPEKTARLIAALKVAVPFEINLTPEVVKQLQAENFANPVHNSDIVKPTRLTRNGHWAFLQCKAVARLLPDCPFPKC